MRHPLLIILFVSLVSACASEAPDIAPAPHVGVPGRCEEPALNGGGAEGCYFNANLELAHPPTQAYWHIDRFPTPIEAERANTGGGVVVLALGNQVFLQTINGQADWRPNGGEHLATVGPIVLNGAEPLRARLMEATTSSASVTHPHIHPGPEAFFLLSGSICVETPEAPNRAGPAGSFVLPGNTPMQLNSPGDTVRRSLVLVIHSPQAPWIDRQPHWTPRGVC